jgi:hypothetical protein
MRLYLESTVRIAPIRVDRMRRHALNIGPAPRYQMSRLVAKDNAHIDGPKIQRAWSNAVPHKGPATVSVADILDPDYIRMTIRFDSVPV